MSQLRVAFLVLLTCALTSCLREDSSLYFPMQATVEGEDFASNEITADAFHYQGEFQWTKLNGKSGQEKLRLIFDPATLQVGVHTFQPLGDTLPGVTGTYSDLAELIDPESEPIYTSVDGTITITEIDTATVNGVPGVITDLEATFSFTTDNIHGPSRTITDGEVTYHK